MLSRFADPVKFTKLFWPQFRLYDKQREILFSLRDNYETIVPAGNELGKDFICAPAILWFFCSRQPARIVTTSPNSSQLNDVLWGEIRRFAQEAKYPLPIEVMGNMEIYKLRKDGTRYPKTEIVGRVYQKGEGMLGRHSDRTSKGEPTTLLVVDEASGSDNESYQRADTWTHRKLVVGNPYPCSNFFYNGVREGNRPTKRPHYEHLHRNVIKIKGEDSPNVKLALAEIKAGKEPSHKIVIPGVLTYADYIQRRESWDKIRQCVGLDAEFYEGAEVLLYPPDWLNNAQTLYNMIDKLRRIKEGIDKSRRLRARTAKGIGADTAEGGDNTTWAASDEYGLIDLTSMKTPDTSVISGNSIAFGNSHGLKDWSRFCFDRGGGGKQVADMMRRQGYNVRTVGFGTSATEENTPGISSTQEKRLASEQRYVYFNKRAEMAGRLSLRLDPSEEETKYSISSEYTELLRQLRLIPKVYDSEGRLRLPPKNKKNKNSKEITLTELIGHSPDELDAVMLSVYGMEVTANDPVAGTILKPTRNFQRT